MTATFRDYGEGFYGWYDEGGNFLGTTEPISYNTDPELPAPAASYSGPPTTNTPVPAATAATSTGTTSGTSAIGINYTIPTPISYDANGAPVYRPNDPAFYQSEIAIREANRAALREAAAAYGLNSEILITMPGSDGKTYLELGPNNFVDISSYFAGIPSGPTWQDVAVPRDTVGYETGYGGRTVQIEPPLQQSVTVQLPTGENVVVDPNSELARYIQYLGTQPDPLQQVPIGAIWAKNGVSDPYSDPATVKYAIESLERAKQQQAGRESLGLPTSTPQWNDPNWPAYVGSNPQAFQEALRAQNDPAYAAQLKAANNWDQNTFETWSRRVLNPEEQNAIDEAYWAGLGFVTGPSSSGTGTSKYGLTAAGTSMVEAQVGGYTSSGFPVTSYSSLGVNNPVDAATGAVNNLLNTGTNAINNAVNNAIGSAGAVATAALAGYASAQAALSSAQNIISNTIKAPTALPSALSPFVKTVSDLAASASSGITQIENLFSGQAATLLKAKAQATFAARYNQAASGDWRVRLQLGPAADYLYKDPNPGILAPLFNTDGIIFPYMPSIETSYAANYDKYDLTHSNYRGYFYKGSNVNDVNIRATFTAQDTQEANYLLAVIHFFRSATKMFYGQDGYRGAPPPLVFLTGLGDFQFKNHPCLIASFNYSLPNDVDYIRAMAPNNYGNLFSQRDRTGSANPLGLGSTATRLLNAGLGLNTTSSGYLNNNVNNINGGTYVPTKMEINVTLLPTNTRSQVSQQFSVKDFANGKLIKGGFW